MADSVTRSLIIGEAQKRNWQVSTVGHDDYFCKLTHTDGRTELLRGSRPLRSSANGLVISKYKQLTLEYVTALGYQPPEYLVVTDFSESAAFVRQHKRIVVKPVAGQQSQGVTVDVDSEPKLHAAIEYALQFSPNGQLLLQRQLVGNLYRLLVINGKLIAAALRRAAEVTGDGEHTIRQLIERANQDSRRGDDNSTPLKRIKMGDAEAYVGVEAMNRVPTDGDAVRVSAIDSVSAGGTAANVTSQVHDDWKRVTGEIANSAGLFVAGYDVICEDISRPLEGNYVPILEINSAPGLKIHHFPTGGGKPINVASLLLDELF